MDLNPSKDKYFDLLAISDVQMPLWNVPDIFIKFQKDLLMGAPVNEQSPHLVLLRLNQIVSGPVNFIISYKKKTYASYDEAKADSVL